MDIIRNIKDMEVLRNVVHQHIDKYLQTDVENRDLLLLISGVNNGITAIDLDSCLPECPFYEDHIEEFIASGHTEIIDLKEEVAKLKFDLEELKSTI